MTRRRLVVWRHGRTEWNLQHRFQGQTDVPLDQVGVLQARRAAALLAELDPDALVSSDLRRAADTAQELAARVSLPVRLDPGLRETFAGEWQGLTRAELESRYAVDLAAWGAGEDVRPGGGETRTEVADRMVAAIGSALAEVPSGGTLVVATHGGAARAAIGRLMGLPMPHWAALGVLSNAAWSVLVENTSGHGPGWRLQEYNAGSLPEPALADDR